MLCIVLWSLYLSAIANVINISLNNAQILIAQTGFYWISGIYWGLYCQTVGRPTKRWARLRATTITDLEAASPLEIVQDRSESQESASDLRMCM